jgi:hypothetical protein
VLPPELLTLPVPTDEESSGDAGDSEPAESSSTDEQ